MWQHGEKKVPSDCHFRFYLLLAGNFLLGGQGKNLFLHGWATPSMPYLCFVPCFASEARRHGEPMVSATVLVHAAAQEKSWEKKVDEREETSESRWRRQIAPRGEPEPTPAS